MRRVRALFCSLVCGAFGAVAIAAPPTANQPWLRATPPGVTTAAAYAQLEGHGTADRLIEARSDSAERVEIHTHVHDNGLMTMKRIDALAVPAAGVARLIPGADHLMLIGLHRALTPGSSVTIKLVFERSGEIEVSFPVIDARAEPPATPAAMRDTHDH